MISCETVSVFKFSTVIINYSPNTPPIWQLPCCWRWRWWSGSIEHLWGILKRKVEKHHVSNIQQLRDVIIEEWKRMPATTCAALVNPMPRRIKVSARWQWCPYKILTLWTQFWRSIRVYLFLLPVIWTIMVICWVIFRGQYLYFYTSCTLTTLKYIQVSFVQYCP